jgi:tRNA dimethylallyltransferase
MQGVETTQVKKPRFFETIKIGLSWDRDELYRRINKRVDIMIENGLLKEAQSLFKLKDLNALQTVGYQELFRHFEGTDTLEFAIDKIKQHSRNYAKRQLTWFKKDEELIWFKPADISEIKQLVENKLKPNKAQ